MTRLEQTILKNLVYNEEFTRKVLPFIQIEYFSDSIERKVFAEIKEFVNRYEQVPTHEALVINFTEKKELTEDEVSKSIELLNEIKTTSDEKVDQSWLTEQTEKFCQDLDELERAKKRIETRVRKRQVNENTLEFLRFLKRL